MTEAVPLWLAVLAFVLRIIIKVVRDQCRDLSALTTARTGDAPNKPSPDAVSAGCARRPS
ncbi:hypothetical protein [Brevundimonas sp.]